MYAKDDVIKDYEEGVFASLTEDEKEGLLASINANKEPHQRDLCQRCTERKGPCWRPHNPDDCKVCQKDPRGLCYDPKWYPKTNYSI